MLEKVNGKEVAAELLAGLETGRVRLPNLRSVHATTTWHDGEEASN